MTTRLIIDKAGRVVIPKSLRQQPHLENPGEQITLRPVDGTGPLSKEHRAWVFHTDQPLTATATDETLQQIREERDLRNLGKEE